MNEDINLARESQKTKIVIKGLSLVLLATFVVIFLIAFLVLSYSLLLKGRHSALVRQENELKSKISSLASKKQKELAIRERLGNIRKIMKDRGMIGDKVDMILSVMPSGFDIDSINATGEVVSFKLTSTSLAKFDKLIEEELPGLGKDRKLNVKRIEIASFSQTDNNYSLALSFDFKGNTSN